MRFASLAFVEAAGTEFARSDLSLIRRFMIIVCVLSSLPTSTLRSLVILFWAAFWLTVRYARAKALAHTAEPFADPALQLMLSIAVLAGTATLTCLASWVGVRLLFRDFAAFAATRPDWATWASVSMLTLSPLAVRLPATLLALAALGLTCTLVVAM